MLRLQRKGGISVAVSLAVPNGSKAPRAATLLLDSRPVEMTTAVGGYMDSLANDGSFVMLLHPLPGRTIGLSIDDTRSALAWLRAQQSVNREVTLHGVGRECLVALRVAVLDNRYSRLVVEDLPVSPRAGDFIRATYVKPVTIVNPIREDGMRMSPESFAAAFPQLTASEARLSYH